MELSGVEAERLVRHINAALGSGFKITNKTVEAIGCIMKNRNPCRADATWGIKPMSDIEELEKVNARRSPDRQIPQTYKIVANASFFHPKYMVASGLTYEEAEALLKLLGE